MKNSIIIFSGILLLSMFGCEMSNDADLKSENLTQKVTLLKSIDTDGNVTEVPFTRAARTNNLGINARKSEGNVMVNGHMDYFPNDSDNTWKKSLNANGNATSGKGQVEVKSNFWGDIHGSVICTYAEGNDAVVAMYITNEKESLNPVYTKGKIVWFRLIDNGEGKNAPADQHYNRVWYTTEEFESIEDAQVYILEEVSCLDILENFWGTPVDIQEGNFQVK
jgi:hypothetical protein